MAARFGLAPSILGGEVITMRARFEREAKSVSSLHHPHICMLHGVGREGDSCARALGRPRGGGGGGSW
jgi:hypothetical protein